MLRFLTFDKSGGDDRRDHRSYLRSDIDLPID